MSITSQTISQVIYHCNRDIVPDSTFDPNKMYPSEWFIKYFDYLCSEKDEKYLGEAFYQARFMYKIMSVLRFKVAKQRAIIRFQIVQYASICEAILQKAIERYFLEEFENKFAVKEFRQVCSALSSDTKVTIGTSPAFLCVAKTKKADVKRERSDHKSDFALSKGIISKDTKDRFDSLYDSRNNIHILKASKNSYSPTIAESKEAFMLVQKLVSEVKSYYSSHPLNS